MTPGATPERVLPGQRLNLARLQELACHQTRFPGDFLRGSTRDVIRALCRHPQPRTASPTSARSPQPGNPQDGRCTLALFQVMAGQPDVRLLGTVTDHSGQRGVGLALGGPASSGGSRQPVEVVVDPGRGQILEADYALPSSTVPAVASVGVASVGPLWTDVVASGIVRARTATVPTSPSRRIGTQMSRVSSGDLMRLAAGGQAERLPGERATQEPGFGRRPPPGATLPRARERQRCPRAGRWWGTTRAALPPWTDRARCA